MSKIWGLVKLEVTIQIFSGANKGSKNKLNRPVIKQTGSGVIWSNLESSHPPQSSKL